MSYITLKCKNCGSGISINPDSKTATCTHCGSTFLMIDLLDEKDMNFSKSISKENLQAKIDFADALKQGETHLYQAEYTLAEQCFKRAIELDDKNFKGYFGVVKAKTSNLNKIPETPEYKEFAKYALKLVDSDNEIYLKSELAKLDLLEHEKKEKDKELEKRQSNHRIQERNRQLNEKFWGQVTTSLIVLVTVILLVCIYITKVNSINPDDQNHSTYEISSAENFIECSKKDDFLSSTIIIKNDIDFGGINWTPIGTSSNPFVGKFYGNNHTISNLKLTLSTSQTISHSGFFGYANGASIFGLTLDNVSIDSNLTFSSQSTNYVGFVCGLAQKTAIKRCEVLQTCRTNITNSNKNMIVCGGLVGYANECQISYAYSNAYLSCSVTNITSFYNAALSYYVGGVIGYSQNNTLAYCYSSSVINSNIHSDEDNLIISYTGGVIGYSISENSYSQKLEKCFFAGSISQIVSTSNNRCYIAGLIAYGADFNIMQNNFSVFGNNAFVVNSTELELEDLYDYSSAYSDKLSYVLSTEIIEKIEQFYSSNTWNNNTTIHPNLA